MQARQKGLSLRLNIAPDVPEFIVSDPARLRQIIINLIGNAIKFTEQGGIKVEVTNFKPKSPQSLHRDSSKKNQQRIIFTVNDTGIGISNEQADNIFQVFTQADCSTTRKYGGTGLGLAICKKLIDLFEGQIWVESEVNRGSCFFFTIMAETGHEEVEVSEEATPENHSPMDILLVEDEPVNLIVLEQYVSKLGHRATCAESGEKAISLLHEKKFDLVIMDIQMPEMDGLETTIRIRESKFDINETSIPIIALTAHAATERKKECLKVGMNDYVTKPVELKTLARVLSRFSTRNPETGNLSNEPEAEVINPENTEPTLIEPDKAAKRAGIPDRTYQKLCAVFASECPDKIEKLKKCADNKDFQQLSREAHALKNSTWLIGADKLRQIVLQMEEEADGKDENTLNSAEKAIKELEQLFQIMQPHN
jgi:CheY-like chemotaxis protein/HPt (histidine-containing phosphotransfer) domain-containing protein